MTMNEKQTVDERREIEDLLPWHAAGTLARRDVKRVEEALARDAELARRYELVREELGEAIRLNENLGAPSARAMEALFKKIDAEPARRTLPALNLGARVGEFFAGFAPRTLAWSAAAAIVVIALQGAIITGVLLKDKETKSGYQSASAPANDTTGTALLIRFAPQVNSGDITAFLQANNLTLAGGPLPGGLYRARLAMTGLPKADLARIVKELQQNKAVEFISTAE